MSGSPNADLHIYLGDTFTHKQVSIPHQLTIGAVRDKAITEMEAHLRSHCNIQPKMPRPDQVRIFGGYRVKNQTSLKNLNKLQESSSVVAVIPSPAGFSIDDLIDAKLARIKSEHENHLNEVKTEHENHLKEVKTEHENHLKELEHKLKGIECKHEDTLQELSDLRARQHESDNWLVHGDTKALDRIILRNLLDNAQAVLAHALLGSNANRKFMSHYWRNYVMGINKDARLENVRALLSTSTNPTMRQLSASTAILNILMDSSSHIRTDGDNVAHEVHIDRTRYSGAIGRCNSSVDRQALNLFLNLVMTYKWQ